MDQVSLFRRHRANGALARCNPEAVAGELLDASGAYAFAADTLYNLRADRWIAGRSDLTGPEVANTLPRRRLKPAGVAHERDPGLAETSGSYYVLRP